MNEEGSETQQKKTAQSQDENPHRMFSRGNRNPLKILVDSARRATRAVIDARRDVNGETGREIANALDTQLSRRRALLGTIGVLGSFPAGALAGFLASLSGESIPPSIAIGSGLTGVIGLGTLGLQALEDKLKLEDKIKARITKIRNKNKDTRQIDSKSGAERDDQSSS